MKNAFWLLLGLVLVSCNKIKQLTQIEQDITYTQSLDASKFPDSVNTPVFPSGGLKIVFPTVPVSTNSQQYIQQYNTAINKINSVTLKSVVLQMTQPPGKYLDFLKDISLSIGADTLPMIRVAYKYNIPKRQTSISLGDTNTDLTKYFLQDKIYFQVTVTFDSIPPPGTQINTITTFHLSANPLN